MASNQFKAGPSDCIEYVPYADATLPSFSTLAFTASGVTLDASVFNSQKAALATTTNYQVCICPVGADPQGGYVFGVASPSSGNLTVTAGQSIEVTIQLAAFPANYQYGLLGIFLKTGSGDFQFVKFVRPSTSGVTKTAILRAPLSSAESFLLTTLQSTTNPLNQKALSSTAAARVSITGWTQRAIAPTTDSVSVIFANSNSVTFRPNSSADFTVVGGRALNVSFQGMINSEDRLTAATAGDWGSWTSGGVTYQEAAWGLNTTSVRAKGNSPFVMKFPADPGTGVQTDVLFTGLLLQNTEEVSLAWSKGDQTAVTYNYNAASLDAVNINADTVFTTYNFTA